MSYVIEILTKKMLFADQINCASLVHVLVEVLMRKKSVSMLLVYQFVGTLIEELKSALCYGDF